MGYQLTYQLDTGDEMAKTKYLDMSIYYLIEEKYQKHLILP